MCTYMYVCVWSMYRISGNFRGIKFSRVIISCDNIFVVWGYPRVFLTERFYTNLVPRFGKGLGMRL